MTLNLESQEKLTSYFRNLADLELNVETYRQKLAALFDFETSNLSVAAEFHNMLHNCCLIRIFDDFSEQIRLQCGETIFQSSATPFSVLFLLFILPLQLCYFEHRLTCKVLKLALTLFFFFVYRLVTTS